MDRVSLRRPAFTFATRFQFLSYGAPGVCDDALFPRERAGSLSTLVRFFLGLVCRIEAAGRAKGLVITIWIERGAAVGTLTEFLEHGLMASGTKRKLTVRP